METVMCMAVFLLFSAHAMYAQELVDDVDSIEAVSLDVTDTLVVQEDLYPDWYVAPLPYDSVMGKHRLFRRAAASCPVDSMLTFDVDSNLASVTIYEYGDTTRTIIWTVNPDGSRVGQSKQEEAITALTSYTAFYDWDNTTHDWKGVSRIEYVYYASNLMESNTSYAWINHTWVPDTRETYAYDAFERPIEYIAYSRNANNILVPSQGFVYTWYNASKKTLEINYTAYSNGAWSAGTKTECDYDANGNNIEKTYYSSISNGNWVGSTHEVWHYNASNKKTNYLKQIWSNGMWENSIKELLEYNGPSGKQTYYEKQIWGNGVWANSAKEQWEFNPKGSQTLHEKYSYSNSDWVITLREISGYDDSNRNTSIENYSYTNGVAKGTRKEDYMYYEATTKKTSTTKYKWSNSVWVYNTKLVNDYDAAGNTTETANYIWINGAWKGSSDRILKTFNSAKKVTEQITQTWSTEIGDWLNTSRKTTEYSGSKTTQEASYIWFNGEWIGSSRSDWHYNAAGYNDTIKTYTNNGLEWVYSDRTVNTFNTSGINIMTHKSHWDGSAWLLVSMTRTDIVNDAAGRQLLNATWHCGSDSVWIGDQKDTTAYSATGKIIYRAIYDSWDNNDWVPYFTVEYLYDDHDRNILEQRLDWNGDAWKGIYRYEYGYDEQGRQNMSATYSGWDKTTNSWIGSTKTEQTFNANNKVSLSIFSVWGENAWRQVFRYIYTYDSAGREIEHTVEHFDDPVWTYTDKYIKVYEGNRLLKDNSFMWMNEQWIYSSRNETYYDNDAQAKVRRQVNGSWSNGVLLSFADNLYHYACDVPSYTIRFVNYDGTELSSQQVQQGETPEYSGTEPTKAATAQYTYTFKGWNPAITAATANATYTAEYDSAVVTYTITFKNYDGTELQSGEVAYGTTPSYTGTEPTKAATPEYTYSFTGWSPAIASVTAAATYTAEFDSTKVSYLITFKNGDQVLQSTQVEYGTTPSYTGETPNKPSTGQYTYTFTGWDPEIALVTGAATYNATFTATTKTYTVTWLYPDGTEIDHESLEYGATPTHADAEKAATAEWTYTFTGWTPSIATVTGDATYTAQFDSVRNTYIVTWLYPDGTEIDHESLEYGATPTHADATKDNTAEYTYTFIGWTPSIATVTGNATYTAQIDSVRNSYTVTWLNADGTEISHETLEYGVTPEYSGAEPSKPATAEWTYTFTGWTPSIATVTGDATYTAQFDSVINTYTVTFKSGEDVLQSTEVEYGATPSYAGGTPNKPSTAQYTYTFTGWSPSIVTVTGDATYTAQFDSVINTYTIIFYFEDGETILDELTVAYGEIPSTPLTPSSTHSDDQYTYTFVGWSPEIVPATSDASYTAVYTRVLNQYTVTFKNYNNQILQSVKFDYGSMPEYTGVTPYKPSTNKYTYEFTGWTPELDTVKANATYKAVFESVIRTFTILFLDEDGETVLDNVTVEYGQKPVYTGATPTKPDDEQYTYTFAGWTPKIVAATADASYKATYTATPISHEAIENVNSSSLQGGERGRLILLDGVIYILRGGKTYTLDGHEVE